MAQLLIDDTELNFDGEVYSQNQKLLTEDELSLESFSECIIKEAISTSKPVAIFLDSYNSTKKLVVGKKVDNLLSDVLIGILLPGTYSQNEKVKLLTKGTFIDSVLVAGSLSQSIYINIQSECDTTYTNLKIGEIVEVSPARIFTNIGKETSDNDSSKIRLDFMEGSPFLSTSIAKLNFIYTSGVKTYLSPNTTKNVVAAAVNPNTGRIVIFINNTIETYYSDDNGETWNNNSVNYPGSGLLGYVNDFVGFLNGEFIGLTSTHIIRSSDGITWTTMILPVTFPSALHIHYANGIYVFSGGSFPNSIATTTDFVSWNLINTSSIVFSKTIYTNNTWIGIQKNDSSKNIIRSTDNFATFSITSPLVGANFMVDITTYGDDIVIARANGERHYLTTSLGTIQISINKPLTQASRCETYNGLLIIAGDGFELGYEILDLVNQINWVFTFEQHGGGPIIKTNNSSILIFSKQLINPPQYYRIAI